MIQKGLPNKYKTFSTVITKRDTRMTFQNFKTTLRNFEEAEKTDDNTTNAVMNLKERKYSSRPTAFISKEYNKTRFNGAYFSCRIYGHKSENCKKHACKK